MEHEIEQATTRKVPKKKCRERSDARATDGTHRAPRMDSCSMSVSIHVTLRVAALDAAVSSDFVSAKQDGVPCN